MSTDTDRSRRNFHIRVFKFYSDSMQNLAKEEENRLCAEFYLADKARAELEIFRIINRRNNPDNGTGSEGIL